MHTRRENVLFIDRVGYDWYRMPDGGPVLDPERYRVTLLTRPGLGDRARPGECAEVMTLDIGDDGLRDGIAEAVHRRVGIDHVLAFTEGLLLPAARLRDRLGIPGPSADSVVPFRDKSAMKAVARGGGLPVAEWAEVDTAAEALPLLAAHGRIVLKPRAGYGSAGLHIVSTEARLRELDADPTVDLTYSQAEQFVDAPMVHIDAAVCQGRLHTVVPSRYLTSTLAFTEGRPLSTVTLDDPGLVEKCVRFTEQVVEAFKVTDSVLHLEAFLTDDGRLVFSEVACRAGGSSIGAMVRSVTGVSIHEAMVRLALGEAPTTTYPQRGAAAGLLLVYGRHGRVARIDDDAVPREWLVERRHAVEPGQWFRPAHMAGGGLATYVVTGSTQREVRERLAFVEAHTHVVYAADQNDPEDA
ncbi:hypothetical protein [Streptomyces tremellae]|uniref:ATP-grasp domain-containing protein n=1 Tax=Streptomyces tremellae TaxID=1124239 RepID=A0ABP7FWH1_9ACTN